MYPAFLNPVRHPAADGEGGRVLWIAGRSDVLSEEIERARNPTTSHARARAIREHVPPVDDAVSDGRVRRTGRSTEAVRFTDATGSPDDQLPSVRMVYTFEETDGYDEMAAVLLRRRMEAWRSSSHPVRWTTKRPLR